LYLSVYHNCAIVETWLPFRVLRFALATKENKKQNIFSEKQKGFKYGLSYSTPQKEKKQGKCHYPVSVLSH